nr:unnamed protein product [Digitaria exilis]
MASSVLLRSLLLDAVATFLLQLSMIATSQTSKPEQPAVCSPKPCGNLNITYPFWLEDPGQSPCGSPPFQLKCNISGASPEVLPGFRRLNCSGNDSFVGFGRRFGSSGVRYKAIPPGCLVAVVSVLPVLVADRHDYVASMRKGFLLEWTPVSGDCSRCTASGGECMYPDNGVGFSCNCPDGIHYPTSCG